ncbi:tail fiber assembly protein [Pseudomonas avellanae]|uniref:tail fiber assembly protein n=1 Tax=Pseudomonas avellanae TaxID=46257 RepID=UPI0006204BB9|nr:tail assembly chaperone [Pseudomonas avellanae]UQW75693.1 tail assembly chaperone [Pseudomonas avellanae]
MSENTDTAGDAIAVGSWWALPDAEPAPLACSYDPLTREFIGAAAVDPSPLEPGVWLIPALAVLIERPARIKGFAPILSQDGTAWEQVEDLRGQEAYEKATAQPVTVTELGPLDEAHTFKVPTTPIDTWQDGGWAPDPEALRQRNATRKALLSRYAAQQVGTLQNAETMGMATEAELQALESWKRYAVMLNRVDPAADAEWPIAPDAAGAIAWLQSQSFDTSY